MLILENLLNMTGPDIVAHNREHPVELDALAEALMIAAGWEYVELVHDGGHSFGWIHEDEEDVFFECKRLTPTLDANQTRKLVEAVGEGEKRYVFGKLLRGFLNDFDGIDWEPPDLIALAFLAPLPLVTAAACVAMGGEK